MDISWVGAGFERGYLIQCHFRVAYRGGQSTAPEATYLFNVEGDGVHIGLDTLRSLKLSNIVLDQDTAKRRRDGNHDRKSCVPFRNGASLHRVVTQDLPWRGTGALLQYEYSWVLWNQGWVHHLAEDLTR
jgi:hypothetical protein